MTQTPDTARKALVIDDDPSNLDVLRVMLGRAGFEVQAVSSGREGIAAADASFALIFVDLHLPDVFGTEVVSAVRQAGPATFVVVATMDDDFATMRAAYEAGCDMFLVKPYDLAQVLQIAREAHRGQRWIVDRHGLREYLGVID
jgi:CheY-like chemotaxis protein